MIYIAVISLAVGVVVAVAALVMITTRDDPMGLGRTNQQAFTKGMGSIFGGPKKPSRS
jgi:hypothetical protein